MTARLLAPPVKRCRMFATTARLGFTVAMVLMFSAARLGAFALLGPYAPWMTPAIGYQYPGDIGGPMNIGEEYRWNVPVVTYAFDQSFLDYFGSNGVAAVEQAIQILNDLPPASGMVLTNFPLQSAWFNVVAANENLYDLKSAALALVVEQLGLAQPIRNIYNLAWLDPTLLYPRPGIFPPVPDSVIMRNFDPDTLVSTAYVNGLLFVGYAVARSATGANSMSEEVLEQELGTTMPPETAIADWPIGSYLRSFRPGVLYRGLTWDDVGGLRYLLSTNNVNLETLLPDVHGAGTNGGAYVNLALRPGVEKLTFVRQEYDPLLGQAIPLTTNYTDTYITNGMTVHQQVERVITQPDFLFCVADTGEGNSWTPDYLRTGTSNWWNSASVSGGTNAGPGIVRPPVRMTFHKLGPVLWTRDPDPQATLYWEDYRWGSFDDSTNAPVAYPVGLAPVVGPMTLRFRLDNQAAAFDSRAAHSWQWYLTNCAQVTLQTSTNLAEWLSCATVTNLGSAIEWRHQGNSNPAQFFRFVAQ